MRVLLISPNKETLPDPVYPLGLAYVASGLREAGHEVVGLDLFTSEDIEASIKNALEDFRPEAIGISLRNVDDVSYPRKHSYLTEYKSVINALREETDAPIILGGSGFTIMPAEFMRELGADYGIRGEGEQALPTLFEMIAKSRIARGTVLCAERINALNKHRPARDVFDSSLYYQAGGMLNIQSKRGCAFGCVYCTYPSVEGRTVRLREPKGVVDELEEVVSETGARHFFFVDSVFNYPIWHAEAICREIIKRNLKVRWSCYCSPSAMTVELAELMAQAGCTGVEFGTDSLNDEGLRRLGKGFDFEQVRSASLACKSAGLKFCHFIFIGAPGDTAERARENFLKLDELNPHAAVIMAGIRVFPGTQLEEIARAELGIKGAGLEPVFYITEDILRNIENLAEEASKRKNWAMPGFEINIYDRLQKRLRQKGIKGPLWEGLSDRIR